MDKVLELSIRATIQYLEGNMTKFNEYRNKAIDIHQAIKEKEVYRYQIKTLIPKETERKLYKLVN